MELGQMTQAIGTLNEKPLHAALKRLYTRPGDRTEVRLDGWVIDVVRDDCLVEIQTRQVSAIKRKLTDLVEHYPVRLVFPIAYEKWIVRLDRDGEHVLGRRKSPKRGCCELVFEELVSIPSLLLHPNFSLEVVLIQEEEIRHADSTVNWRRRGWAVSERRLLGIVAQRVFESPAELCRLVPAGLPAPFTTRQLSEAIGQPLRLAQMMAYSLREMGALQIVGASGRSSLYARA
jgi:hypothetical protein